MGIQWNAEDGKTVGFWWDCLTTKTQPLINYALAPIPNNLVLLTMLAIAIGRVLAIYCCIMLLCKLLLLSLIWQMVVETKFFLAESAKLCFTCEISLY